MVNDGVEPVLQVTVYNTEQQGLCINYFLHCTSDTGMFNCCLSTACLQWGRA